MIEIDPTALDDQGRARWKDVLDRDPVLAEREVPRSRGIEPLLVGLGAVLVGGSLLEVGYRLDGIGARIAFAAAVGGIGTALVVGTMLLWARARRTDRSAFRCGRFLYRWGFAEVTPERIRIVPGREIIASVAIGRPRLSGASPIRITLRAGSWSAVFRLRGSELDVPREALEELPRARMLELDGYRDRADAFGDAREPRPRRWNRVPIGVWAIAAGTLGCAAIASVQAESAVERWRPYDLRGWRRLALEVPAPWIVSRYEEEREIARALARAEVAHTIAEPYRAPLLDVLAAPDARFTNFRGCQIEERPEHESWRHAADGMEVLPFQPGWVLVDLPLWSVLPHDLVEWSYRDDGPGFFVECEPELAGVVDDGEMPRALVGLRVRWALVGPGDAVVERELVVEAEWIERTIARSTTLAALDRRGAWSQAAGAIISAAIVGDLFLTPPSE